MMEIRFDRILITVRPDRTAMVQFFWKGVRVWWQECKEAKR